MMVRNKDADSELFSDQTTITRLLSEGGTAAIQRHLARAIDLEFNRKRYINKPDAFQLLKNIVTLRNSDSITYSYSTSSRNAKSMGFLFLHRDNAGTLNTVEFLKKDGIVLHEKPENHPRQPGLGADDHIPYPDWPSILAN